MKSKFLAGFIVVCMILGGTLGILALLPENLPERPIAEENFVSYSELDTFSSYEEMDTFLDTQAQLSGSGYYIRNLTGSFQDDYWYYDDFDQEGVSDLNAPTGASSGSRDHSDTNVQVQGVDEGDIIKTDGEYAYIISRNQTKVFIVDVYPPEDAHIVYTFDFEWTVRELYLNFGKLVILGSTSYYYSYRGWYWDEYYSYEPETNIRVYDLEFKDSPTLYKKVELAGSYVASRMIGDYLYLIVNQFTSQIEEEDDLPTSATNVYYSPEFDYRYTLTSIVSVDCQDPVKEPNIQSILLGTSTHIYVSQNNIYLTYTKQMSWVEQTERKVEEVIVPMVPIGTQNEINDIKISESTRVEKLREIDILVGDYKDGLAEDDKEAFTEEYNDRYEPYEKRLRKDIQKTMIHRIYIKDGFIEYQASGGVRGHVLNRFSMDEYRGYFRIATTSGQRWWWSMGESTLANNVFVCSMDLKITGAVNDIAPGESIYSARFMGKRGYLVTFKKVDPFFVIDVSDPNDPSILGELKIPGYSNYLHPYDEDHVIGIGKDAFDMGDFAWYQGVKLSLFDVTDVTDPKEKSKFIIGDRGTESLALTDPHAFLFSASKDMIVIPIVLAEIDDSKYPGGAPPQTHGETVWCGAYVINVDDENGFSLHGKVSHLENEDDIKNYRYGDKRIKRTFYIEDTLYTLSDYLLESNHLDDLSEISSVELRD
jgi:uncharacterized secreted protein with C-terminal beta-propeller domain